MNVTIDRDVLLALIAPGEVVGRVDRESAAEVALIYIADDLRSVLQDDEKRGDDGGRSMDPEVASLIFRISERARAISTALPRQPSQPTRVLMVTGTGTASTTALIRAPARRMSFNNAAPAPVFATLGTQQPMLMSMIAAPAS